MKKIQIFTEFVVSSDEFINIDRMHDSLIKEGWVLIHINDYLNPETNIIVEKTYKYMRYI